MADPFSIAVGTVGLLDVCFRVGKYLHDVKAGADKVDEGIQALTDQIAAIRSVTYSIKRVFEDDLAYSVETFPKNQEGIQSLWEEIGTNLKSCQTTLAKLFAVIELIVGKESPRILSKLDGLGKFLRKQAKEEEFRTLRHQLSDYHHSLQTLLASVNIIFTRNVQSTSDRSFTQISEEIRDFRLSLECHIASLRTSIGSASEATLRRTVELAEKVIPVASPNLYFEVPQSVCSIFTGRRSELNEVEESLLSPMLSNEPFVQKRFVIFGIGGSGKTELCRKFAQENRHCFWGVFWVDASSDDSATQSLARIARAAKIEPPTEFAAKSWLASSRGPWLLIVDNADSLRKPIEQYLPEGEMGCIIVTTRDPALRTLGMPGRRYLRFAELKHDEASDLLLKAADEPVPYSSHVRHLATEITKKLGYLPLALVHAGKAIVTGVCRIHDYLTSFDEHWDRVRTVRSRRGSNVRTNDDSYTIIYSSYEIMYRGLLARMTPASEDALDLLRMFSFLHHENIRVEILLQAANNPKAERKQQVKQAEDERILHGNARAKTWSDSLGSMGRTCYLFLVQLGYQPTLPQVLRIADPEHFDKHRLRLALQELSQMSLITFNAANDSYSMHPLVHTWIRERPESIAEQAVWCQAAATTLAQSILLPPLANTEADEDFRRDLMPHVDHVRKCERTIQDRIASNQKRRRRPWPVLRPQLDRSRIVQLAKFGFVYAQCGLWHDAEDLLTIVFEFLCKVRGMQDPMTIRVSMFLATIYRQLDKLEDAAALQNKVLESCTASCSGDDLRTLEVTDALGVIRWQQGRFRDAGKLHQRAFNGFVKVKGPDDPATLRVKGNMGRIFSKNCEFDEAIRAHSETVTGLKKHLGPSHQDTLSAMDDLAMSYLERSTGSATTGEDLQSAYTIILDVVDHRKKKLGKDHPLSLWAIANLARIENARRHYSEAESLFRAGILVAERNLGPTHIGTLYGKTYLGYVLLCQKRYLEAEAMLISVIDAFQESRPNHPDQVVALSFLLKCYAALGQNESAAKIRERMMKSLESIGACHHPRVKLLFDVNIECKPATG